MMNFEKDINRFARRLLPHPNQPNHPVFPPILSGHGVNSGREEPRAFLAHAKAKGSQVRW